MSNLPKNSAASGMVYGIVVGGHDADPAPDQSGNLRVYFPGIHGKDVDVKHLNFSPRLMSPTKGTQQEFPGGLDPGSLVVALKDTGSNYCQIIGLANDTNRAEERIPGNTDLLQFVKQYLSTELDIRRPPNIQETTKGGAKVKIAKEKGKHHHNLLKGLPTHGALYNMCGTILPQVTGVATAIQSASSLLDDAIASVLPGAPFSLGNLLGNLPNDLMKALDSALPPGLMDAFNNMNNLMQTIEAAEGAAFSLAAKCDPTTFMNNAVGLLSKATNLSEMVSTMQRLQTDTSLYGLDKLPFTPLVKATGFGNVLQRVDPLGNVLSFAPPEVAKAAETAMSLMSSATSFPGVNIGQNFFGDGAKTVMSMINRLPAAEMGKAMSMLNALNTSGAAQKAAKFVKDTSQGANPFKNFGG